MPKWASIFLVVPAAAALSGFAGLPAEGAWVGKTLCLLLMTAFLAVGVLGFSHAERRETGPPA